MGSARLRFLYPLILFCLLPAALFAADSRGSGGYTSGTTKWGVLNALGRDAQLKLLRAGQYHLFGALPQANLDVGNIAVINVDNTILVPANPFNLAINTTSNGMESVTFTPDGGGYRVSAGGYALDKAAMNAGTPVTLQDDDTKSFPLGFSFPFFGKSYDSVFVNSDGNLTFTGGDVAISARDMSRFLSGLPRIAPFFSDLNPSDPAGGQVLATSAPGRFTVTWNQVRACCSPPPQPFATFQVSLYSDGHMVFAYDIVSVQYALVGISPGSFFATPQIVHFSDSTGSQVVTLPIAETFQPQSSLSETGAARKFYATHEDAYDFLILFHNIQPEPDMGGAFAYEMNIANNITGIGDDTYNYTRDFSSSGQLSSFVNMGSLAKFPSDPTIVVPGVSPNTTLSVMGQEAGHKWLVKFAYPFNGDPRNNVLLGRDNEHWSFFFNSDGSVMEGNTIIDNGNGTFTTGRPVWHYNTFDQYAMGLIPPEQVLPSFVVVNPSLSIAPGHAPTAYATTFSGTRVNATIDNIIQANGTRFPAAAIANKNFRFAFVLLNASGTTAPSTDVSKVDTIRQAWEGYWNQATSGLSTINTQLLRGISLVGLPAALAPGAQIPLSLHAAATDTVDRSFTITSSNSSVSVPGSVTIRAGSSDATFQVTGNTTGVSTIRATASGYETAEGSASVAAPSQMSLRMFSGDGQVGPLSGSLPNPLVVEARDAYSLPVAGAPVRFSAPSGVTLSPQATVTDANGHAQTSVTLGSSAAVTQVSATIDGSSVTPVTFNIAAVGPAQVAQGAAVNAASFTPGGPVSPGSIVALFGSNLSAGTQSAPSLPLPVKLAGASVTIGGVAAPLYYVSPGQINLQMPYGLTGTSAPLVVNNGASSSNPINVPLASAAPGVFMMPPTTNGAITHKDGSLVQTSSPAAAGDLVVIYCTGLGALNSPLASGAAAPGDTLIWTAAKPQVTIGGIAADLTFWGLTPGLAGLYQVNAIVPAGLPSGSLDMVISTSSGSSSPVKIAIQ